MKKSVWIILFALLAFAALPALAVTDGELLSVEIVESAMPDALPAAGISGAVVGNAAEPTGEERTSSEWPELDAVKVLSADSIEQIEWIAYTEGGAQRTVITDRTAVSDVHARCCVLSLDDETDIGGGRQPDAHVCYGGRIDGAPLRGQLCRYRQKAL